MTIMFYFATGKLFASSKTSAMNGAVTLFEENIYFMSIYKLIMHKNISV